MHADAEGVDPRFRLESFVGGGASGSVWRAVDTGSGAPVAVKRLHDHLCEPTMVARFEREARLLSMLDSPYVVRHVAHGRDASGRPFLVLEWLDGEDLASLRRRTRLTERDVRELGRQAALGLSALHEAGIVHRDVKPANFFLVHGSHVKLIDLGVARVTGESSLTELGLMLGTPAYMSPEQAAGARRPTAASDLFSLGVVLFELITGTKPYRGDDLWRVAIRIALQAPPQLRDVLPEATPELDAILARAMTKSADDRFPSARAMAEALGGQSTPRPRGAAVRPAPVTALFATFQGVAQPAAAVEALRVAVEHESGVLHRALGPHRVAVFEASDDPREAARRALRAARALHAEAGVRLAAVSGVVLPAMGFAGELIDHGLEELGRALHEVRVDETTARLLGDDEDPTPQRRA